MTHLSSGAADPVRLLRQVNQFLFFIEHRLHLCNSAQDAVEILPGLAAAVSRLDQAIVQIASRGRRAASTSVTRPVHRAPHARSPRLGRR